MTIQQAIERTDALCPNTASRFEKIRWLNELDGRIAAEVASTHVNDGTEFEGYDENTDPETVLLASFPYDDIYPKWLVCQIDLTRKELERYNNSVAVFNEAYSSFVNWYNRTREPLGCRLCYFGRRKRHEGPLS